MFDSYENSYTMYSGITKEVWDNIWRDKNLRDRETNATSDLDFASDYSYNFKTGTYEDLVVQISNIPLEAFVAYRDDDYDGDDDFESMDSLSPKEKERCISQNSIFLLNLYPYRDIIRTELVSTQ